MTTTTNVKQTKLNIMTQSQYNSATKEPTELYMVTDAQISYNDLTDKPTIPTVTSQLTNDSGYITGITSSDVTTALGYTPQAQLTSGINIKTINGNSILGSGNLDTPYRNIGEIVASTIPLTDAGLHLLDGALLQYGSYQAFIDYIADLYDSGDYTAIFDTEASWQASVTQYGVCGKFVYDSVNNTVRLPKYSNKIYTGGGSAPVVGNGIGLGLTDGTTSCALTNYPSGYNLSLYSPNSLGTAVGTTTVTGSNLGSKVIGVTTDGSKSGLIAQLSNITTSVECYYYIVVATSTKTDIQVDIDEIATDLNGKADVDLSNVSNTAGFRKLVELYNNGTSWYKVFREYNPSTGALIGKWCEQGGSSTASSSGSNYTVSLLKPFINTNYILNATVCVGSEPSGDWYSCIISKAQNSFIIRVRPTPFDWVACGYIS